MRKHRANTVSANTPREAIRAVATKLFAEKGFTATTTREICREAGVTKPVLYYHFGSKEQLFRELTLDACNESRKQLLLAARRGKTAREKMIEVVAADFELTRRNPGLSRILFRMIFAPEKESPAIDYVEMGLEWIRLFAGIVAEGVRGGEIKGRPLEIAAALMGIDTLYTMGFLLRGQPNLDRALARRLVDLLMDGCGGNATGR